jgi:uncharacterized membrane protein
VCHHVERLRTATVTLVVNECVTVTSPVVGSAKMPPGIGPIIRSPVVIGTVTVGSPIGTSVITLPGVTSVTVSAVPPAFLTCRNVFGPGVNVSDAAAAV